MLDVISEGLKQKLPSRLVDELLASYQDAKENFYMGGLRLSAVEGGRFCEAALRILEFVTKGKFTDLNHQIDSEKLIQFLKDRPAQSYPSSIRLHLPRTIRVIYDVRNSRDNAHLADGIDPNVQDASLVTSVLDWILAEFVRLYHNVSATEAQNIIESLVIRRVPVVESFDDFKKVLNPKLRVSEYVLVLLYECGIGGATFDQLTAWVKPKMRRNLRRTLNQLVDERAFIHQRNSGYVLTKAGIAEVERKKLHGAIFKLG